MTLHFIIPNNSDIIAAVDTFPNAGVPSNYGKVSGTVCSRQNLTVQLILVDMPDHLEFMFLKTYGKSFILLCVFYRPQWQGNGTHTFFQTHLDDFLQEQGCSHAIIVVARTFTELLTVHGFISVTSPHTSLGHR